MRKLFDDLLSRIPLRAVGGEEYSYDCYGKDARYLDLESNVTVIFDEKTYRIFEISIWQDEWDLDASLIWRDPEYAEAFFAELKKRRGISDDEEAKNDEIIIARNNTTENFDEMVTVIRKIFMDNDFASGKRKRLK